MLMYWSYTIICFFLLSDFIIHSLCMKRVIDFMIKLMKDCFLRYFLVVIEFPT